MLKHVRAGLVLFFVTGLAMAAESVQPLWDLQKNDISAELKSGTVEKKDGKVVLKDGAAFAVPANVFADPKNFTVKVTAELSALIENGRFTAMNKEGGDGGVDSGFSFSMNYRKKPWYARHVAFVVNKVFMSSRAIGGKAGPKIGVPYTFTVAVRDGYASFYIDDRPYKKCLMEVVPNDKPLWIGRNVNRKQIAMPVTIHSVKVYGSDYHYISKKEPKVANPRGVVAGKGWALDVPATKQPDWPKVLIYGDSISMGYKTDFISDLLKQMVHVYHCCHFVNGNVPKKRLTEMAGRFPYDVVVFNNGLHSLRWTEDKVSDEKVKERMRDLTRCFKTGAPQAKIYYLMTTPHTARRPGPGQPVNALGELNDVVKRLNRLSAEVMKEEGVEIIDIYPVLEKQLHLAAGDQYHWTGKAYAIISDTIQQRILPGLKKK